MSWFRIEGRMPQHRKVAPLSDAAFRLHITAGAWSAEEGTDGLVPARVVGTLTGAPRGKALVSVLQELVSGGLWEQNDQGYQIHDYLQWNMSAADLAARREAKAHAGKAGGKRSGEQRRSKPEAAASILLKQTGSKSEAKLKPSPVSVSDPSPDLAEADPKDLTGIPREKPAQSAASAAAELPSSLEQALKLPICVRAEALERDKHMASWVLPHKWPEVAMVADALTEASGQPKRLLGAYERDAGVKAVVGLYAMGYTPSLLVAVARGIPTRPWWQRDGANRGLSSLTPEVVARELSVNPLAQPPSPAVAKVLAERDARKAQESQT